MTQDTSFQSPLDFFETPREALLPLLPFLRRPRIWVDLGCGRGAIGRVLFEAFGVQGIGVEFLPERAEQAEQSGAYAHVVRGDVGDREVRSKLRRLLVECDLQATVRESGRLILDNPPFQQWELFHDAALEVFDERNTEDALIHLLPAMAWEKRRTNSAMYKARTRAIRKADARFDIAERPKFFRQFVSEDGKRYVAQKGEAPSAYAYLCFGAQFRETRWRYLESEGAR